MSLLIWVLVEGHKGKLIFGELGGKNVVVMQVTTNSNDQLVINSKHLKISSLITNDIAKVT